MAEEETPVCPWCGQWPLEKPDRLFSLFVKRHPDFICPKCHALVWKLPKIEIPPVIFKPPQIIEEKKAEPKLKPRDRRPWWLKRREAKRRKKQQQQNLSSGGP